ncbi:hypothetical protein CRUP_003332, partial [Coryphaenoides rupestris]
MMMMTHVCGKAGSAEASDREEKRSAPGGGQTAARLCCRGTELGFIMATEREAHLSPPPSRNRGGDINFHEREAVQKKTFTKWVNSILSRVGCRISDLYLDLRDGRMLIKLLEVLSGERL